MGQIGKRAILRWAVPLGLLVLGGAAQASGDYGCDFPRSLEMSTGPCSNAVAIAPGNDTRANLNLLTRDARGVPSVPSVPTERQIWGNYRGTLFEWYELQQSYWPQAEGVVPPGSYSSYNGSRCQTLESGAAAFAEAITAARDVTEADRKALIERRSQFSNTCYENRYADPVENVGASVGGGLDPLHVAVRSSSVTTREFYNYLCAAQAFYAGDWDKAHSVFATLAEARDPWIRETALYMLARVDINAAPAEAFNDWGDFEGPNATDKAKVRRAGEGFIAYLEAYPQGRYARSARGLQRRVLWLGGKNAELAAVYASVLRQSDGSDPALHDMLDEVGGKWEGADRSLLASAYSRVLQEVDPTDPMFADILDEIDGKLIVPSTSGAELRDPVLIATWDLQHMRRSIWDDVTTDYLTLAQIEAQRPLFAGHEDLFDLIRASHAYYVARDYKRVLELIPDAARQERYTAVQFSRQLLRGQALAQRGDRNEAGFWFDLLQGTEPLYQRPLVELGLALSYERAGKTEMVFAANSPITDPDIRETLLRTSAGPDVLRATAKDTARPMPERRTAMHALLWKDLSRGRYADFGRDYALLEGFAPDSETDSEIYQPEFYPLDEFRSGTWAEDFACPDIAATAGRLARNAKDSGALLCLGEFYRLNDFDGYDENGRYYWSARTREGQLGYGPDRFAGTAMTRADLYRAVLAEPSASREQRAYALYRSVWCYGPSGNNDCGGEDVPESRRAAWFRELKTRYADTRWAQELKYYW